MYGIWIVGDPASDVERPFLAEPEGSSMAANRWRSSRHCSSVADPERSFSLRDSGRSTISFCEHPGTPLYIDQE
jgi:hypothetical protein